MVNDAAIIGGVIAFVAAWFFFGWWVYHKCVNPTIVRDPERIEEKWRAKRKKLELRMMKQQQKAIAKEEKAAKEKQIQTDKIFANMIALTQHDEQLAREILDEEIARQAALTEGIYR